ncbi:uncharacterized protein FTOL_06127 [Fusarium torulosum]|uniref:Uncharacterized protein n=1 Tax=Fusarium torulosum TaxID=33205 RepID=A0AAE8SHU3_9HYPO|nr:uncharacterized protein FTOL_06127 [Fusarium torulosum]
MAVNVNTIKTPGDATHKGRVVILNGPSNARRMALMKNLESRLVGCKTQVVDSYIMADPICPHICQRNLRSVYLGEIRKSANQGYTVLVTACLVDKLEHRQVIDDIMAIVCGKDVDMFWVNIHDEWVVLTQQPSIPEHFQEKCTGRSASRRMTPQNRLIFPSKKSHKLDGVSLVTRSLFVGGIKEAVDKISEVMDRGNMRL